MDRLTNNHGSVPCIAPVHNKSETTLFDKINYDIHQVLNLKQVLKNKDQKGKNECGFK